MFGILPHESSIPHEVSSIRSNDERPPASSNTEILPLDSHRMDMGPGGQRHHPR
ncbi:Hypothetical protein FKW44_024218 [Caligus rogercresseyi]|uniref:Uncharacterized protein n=1 Tax=Caligus rogercresseyi TaxID=217165 RepID=A0A7T8GMH5_CALRO|nr:Hypothetical protein FKW44_024218 [Caligus rogercresseyi]